MSSFQSSSKKDYSADVKSMKSSEEGKIYENLVLPLLAKRGYELSKGVNSKFYDFAIGRKISIGEKVYDLVFRYEDNDNKKNLIFVQIKHKKCHYQMDSQALSADTSRERGGHYNVRSNFCNLEKYFISYLRVRDKLNSTKSKELENGKIKYIAIFTNIGLDIEELNNKGFSLKEAPYDIINLFSLKKPSSKTDDFNHCYQLGDVSDVLRRKLKKSSDLHRLAWQIADYVVRKRNYIMRIDEDPMRHYHVALVKEVIETLDVINKSYREAKFNDDFLNNNQTGPKKELRDAIFDAVRELDLSKRYTSDDELKNILRGVNLKVDPNFGKGRNKNMNLPDKWMKIENDDIADFLKCLVFIANQPSVKDLLSQINQEKEAFSQSDREMPDEIYPKFRKQIEEELRISIKTYFKEGWLYSEQIEQFVQEILEAYGICMRSTRYENQVMQYGRFNRLGELIESLNANKAFFVYTAMPPLTPAQIVQYLNIENSKTKYCYISIDMDNLMHAKITDCVKNVPRTKGDNLVIIGCRQMNEQISKETCIKLFNIIIGNRYKRIILIAMGNVLEMFNSYLKYLYKSQCDSDKLYIEKTDDISLKDFEPKENLLKKEVIVFQGQKEKVCLARLTDITNWKYFINYLVRERFFIKQDVFDLITLNFNNDKVEIGSQLLGTCSLDGAYAILFEEISTETLANKLLYLNSDKNSRSLEGPSAGIDNNNDVYIMSGMKGSNIKDKIHELIQYLDLVNEEEEIENLFGDIGSDSKIQIADDQIKEEDFKRICCEKPEKRIFWIDIKYEENGLKFILRQLYNPKFYLKRNFKQVIAMEEVKERLMEKCLSEIFIFCCIEDQEVLIDSLTFTNECEKELFKNKCKNSEILLFTEETDAKAKFHELCKHNKVIHFLKFINKDLNEIFFIKEHNLIKEIKDRKVVIIAGEPGMGKTTTLTKLYGTKDDTESFIETHWVIRINLKCHIQAMKEIKFVNGSIDAGSVVNFLSSIDAKLNHNLAKSLLAVALDKREKFLKPLLLAFDGFDENLDEDDRKNVILLLKFLKEETAAKLWITTSLRYKGILENELSEFALEFDPMDDDFKVTYVKQYLKDRLCLSEKKIAELFVQDNEKQEKVQVYATEFLDKMESVFAGNVSRFIGNPLQLYLMLDGSVRHFKKWIEKAEVESLTFNYLGDDPWEVYEKFIDRKYEFYFQQIDITDYLRQKTSKFIFDQYNEDLAMSLILGVDPKNSLEEFKDTVLSAGIIKSHGNHVEFIHTTFRDYFAAKVFVQWLKKRPNVISNSFKKEYVLKEILQKPDYELIRCFINVKLKSVMEIKSFEECLKYYGMVIKKILRKEESSWIDEEGTVLHIAVDEGNKNIVCFLLKSLKGHPDDLKKFLFIRDKHKRTALDLACSRGNDDDIVKLLSDAETELSKDRSEQLNVQRTTFIDSKKRTLPSTYMEMSCDYSARVHQGHSFKPANTGFKKFCPSQEIEGRSLNAKFQHF